MSDKIIPFITRIRLAKKTDLLHAPGCLKIGDPYYIKHPKTHKLSGPYVITKYTSSKKMQEYFNCQCVYVPVIDFDFDIQQGLQQLDFKNEMLSA